MTERTAELSKTWARVVAKAWADEDYKRRLLADPAAVAKEEGVPVPEGLTLKVVEDAPGTRTLVLPPIPAELGTAVEADERRAAGYMNYLNNCGT
jgi:hypothetical protein